MGFQRRSERLNGVLLLDALGRTFQRQGATYLKARWPYRFVLESLGPGLAVLLCLGIPGPGASRRDLDADLRRRQLSLIYLKISLSDSSCLGAVLADSKVTLQQAHQIKCFCRKTNLQNCGAPTGKARAITPTWHNKGCQAELFFFTGRSCSFVPTSCMNRFSIQLQACGKV